MPGARVGKRPSFFGPDVEAEALFKAKIEDSGLTLEEAEALAMKTVRTFLWGAPAKPALEISYFDPTTGEAMMDGGEPFTRHRVLPEPPPGSVKYLQSKGSAPHAYFPRIADWEGISRDASREILITEGELKAAAATKYKFPTIGLGGVDSFRSRRLRIDFLPELEAIIWERRRVTICFDSDIVDKPSVCRARQTLADELIARGAEVRTVNLPQGLNDQKVGLDDYLVAHGPEVLRKLLDAATEMQPTPDWVGQLQRAPGGSVFMTHANAMIALRGAPELRGCFGFDEMDQVAVVLARLPGEEKSGEYPRRITDADELIVLEWLQQHELSRLTRGVLGDAITQRAQERGFHPVRDHLNALAWDGTPRLATWLHEHLNAKGDREYLGEVGRSFLIAMVARVMEPGCKSDHMLVLQGDQGIGKSTVCRILAGDDRWFSDGLPGVDADPVRLSMHLRGRWLVEVAELSAMSRAETDDLKAFLTRNSEQYIPKYGRREVVEPRQCVFVGTTNASSYLRDETGGRRFWPVTVGVIDTDALKRDRDQLLAEALVRYRAGERWWPDAELEQRVFRPEQEARADDDPWHETISAWLATPDRTSVVTIMGIACGPLMLEPGSVNRTHQNRIRGSLIRQGWEAHRSNGVRTWWPRPDAMVKPADANAAPPRTRAPRRSGTVVALAEAKGRAKF